MAADEEYERGEYSLSELHLQRCIDTLTHTDGPQQAFNIAAAAQRLLRRGKEKSNDMARRASSCPSLNPPHVKHPAEEDMQAMMRAVQAMARARQVMTHAQRDLSHIMQTVDSSSLVQVLNSYSVHIPGISSTDSQNNTE